MLLSGGLQMDKMNWVKPQYEDIRLGMEMTMYAFVKK